MDFICTGHRRVEMEQLPNTKPDLRMLNSHSFQGSMLRPDGRLRAHTLAETECLLAIRDICPIGGVSRIRFRASSQSALHRSRA